MSIADLIRRLADAGASPEAIAIAVDAVEMAHKADAERRAKQAARKKASRARHGTVQGQSQDSRETVTGHSSDGHKTLPLPLMVPPHPLL